MDWTDLLDYPQQITALYGAAPSLQAFRLERIELYGDNVTLWVDFAELPDPPPERWAERGKTRVQSRIDVSGLTEAEVRGAPRLRFNGAAGHEGQPVNLSFGSEGSVWSSEDGTKRPYIVVAGEAEFVSFRFVGQNLNVQAW